ncbi:MAG: hypothetical protein JO063_06660 [Pseudonocardiales bacterium]|nr:hypothetical protein [Pseudonocardiales bacterium]MBV9030627.1 hypothetical protein [Pseudonocardiales bacterium]MBW0009784.1 hypothetical protein [Pseudonocardiales bacterium]
MLPGARSPDLREDDCRQQSWTSREDTVELRELLSVLRRLTDLAPAQAQLLDQECAEPLITVDELTSARVPPVPDSRRVLISGARAAGQDQLH